MSSKGLSVSRRAVLAGVGSMPLAAWAGRAARLKRAPAWERQVELWGMQEVHLASQKSYVNPFADVEVGAEFSDGKSIVRVAGFYDGNGIWKIRFMPSMTGRWSFKTLSSDDTLNGITGNFRVVNATAGNHGPVHPAKSHHFDYADGTPYYLLGTTSYNWLNRDQSLQDATIASLRKSPFNKIRCCLFPKWYVFNRVEPPVFPYVRKSEGGFDLDRFDPRFFANVESRLGELRQSGIVADIILFHPYDKWGFAKMDEAQDKAYLRYVVARLAAFRNVWWTMANEYDLMTERNWDALFRTVYDADPYKHPLSIHQFAKWYDYRKPYVDHVILQDGFAPARTAGIARRRHGKPVVIDEYGYEGDNNEGWGSLSGFEEVARHWEVTMQGAYASHGETYVHPGGVQWWAAGGELVGESPARLGFLKAILTAMPYQDMEPSPEVVVNGAALAKPGHAYLFRFASGSKVESAASQVQVRLAGADRFKVELVDPWCMKVHALGVAPAGDHAFKMPISNGVLRIMAGSQAGEGPKGIGALLANFAGEADFVSSWELKPDPGLFKAEPLHYSIDFQIAQLLQNPAAKAAIERYLPPAILQSKASIWRVDVLAEVESRHGISLDLSAEKLEALQAELAKIEVN